MYRTLAHIYIYIHNIYTYVYFYIICNDEQEGRRRSENVKLCLAKRGGADMQPYFES